MINTTSRSEYQRQKNGTPQFDTSFKVVVLFSLLGSVLTLLFLPPSPAVQGQLVISDFLHAFANVY